MPVVATDSKRNSEQCAGPLTGMARNRSQTDAIALAALHKNRHDPLVPDIAPPDRTGVLAQDLLDLTATLRRKVDLP